MHKELPNDQIREIVGLGYVVTCKVLIPQSSSAPDHHSPSRPFRIRHVCCGAAGLPAPLSITLEDKDIF